MALKVFTICSWIIEGISLTYALFYIVQLSSNNTLYDMVFSVMCTLREGPELDA